MCGFKENKTHVDEKVGNLKDLIPNHSHMQIYVELKAATDELCRDEFS